MSEQASPPKKRQSGRWHIPKDETDLVNLIGELGLVRVIDIESARVTSERSGERGNRVPILELLLDGGKITVDQAKRLELGIGRVIPTCYRCLKQNHFDRESFTGTFICQHCQSPVSLEDNTAGLGDTLLPDPPSRIVDKLIEKLLVKRKLLDATVLGEVKESRKTKIPRPTLVEMLRQQRLLTSKRLIELKGKALAMYHKRIDFWQSLRKDHELACFLCDLRICSQKDLSGALIKQLESAMNGNYLPLRDLLIEMGKLTKYQLQAFLPPQFDNESYRRALLLEFCDFGAIGGDADLEESDWEDSMAEVVQELHHESSSLHVISLDANVEGTDVRSIRGEQAFKSFAEENLEGIDSVEDLKGKRVADGGVDFKVKKKSFYSGGKRKKS